MFAACDKPKTANKTATTTQPEVKKGVAPVADNEIAVIEMEEPAFGTIKIELYSNIAPKCRRAFQGISQRRILSTARLFTASINSVIQGGDPLSKDADPTNDGRENQTNRMSKPNSPTFHTIRQSSARRADSDFNSANSQFFITLRRQPGFDNKYTIFGKVIEGMNYAKTIAGAPKNGERPLEDIKIKEVTIQPR